MGALPKTLAAQVVAWHEASLIDPGARFDGSVPASHPGLWQAIAENHRQNALIWAEEDLARRTGVADREIVLNKRAIDKGNQLRNDMMERIDTLLLEALGSLPAGSQARLHSETPGAMVDRLSIMALKLFHTRAQLARKDIDTAHIALCQGRIAQLEIQRSDLAACLDALLADVAAGRACFKSYYQFKMYNDPRFRG